MNYFILFLIIHFIMAYKLRPCAEDDGCYVPKDVPYYKGLFCPFTITVSGFLTFIGYLVYKTVL